jgi:hypothetical protein
MLSCLWGNSIYCCILRLCTLKTVVQSALDKYMSLHTYEIQVSCEITGIDPAKRINCVKFMVIEADKDGDCLR